METIPAPLKGKVALVTGGSRGIGAGIVAKLVEHGVTHIATTYLGNKDKAEKVLANIREINPSTIKTVAFKADVVDPNFGKLCIEQTLHGLGVDHIDIVVACAAKVDVAEWHGPEELTLEEWNEVMIGNAWSSIALAKAALPVLTSPGGRIIFISSVAASTALPGPLLSYQNSKAALNSATKALAATWSHKHGITVNSISVGPTRTEAAEAAMASNPDFEQIMTKGTLFERIGEVHEVANIVAFVASPSASWLTGNSIPANGGFLPALQ